MKEQTLMVAWWQQTSTVDLMVSEDRLGIKASTDCHELAQRFYCLKNFNKS